MTEPSLDTTRDLTYGERVVLRWLPADGAWRDGIGRGGYGPALYRMQQRGCIEFEPRIQKVRPTRYRLTELGQVAREACNE